MPALRHPITRKFVKASETRKFSNGNKHIIGTYSRVSEETREDGATPSSRAFLRIGAQTLTYVNREGRARSVSEAQALALIDVGFKNYFIPS